MNDYEQLGVEIDNLKRLVLQALRIPQIVEWISKQLKQ